MTAPVVGTAPTLAPTYVGVARWGSIMVQSSASEGFTAGDSRDPSQKLYYEITGDAASDFSTTAVGGISRSAARALQVPLKFQPTVPGARSAVLTVRSGTGESVSVTLTANGLAPVAPLVDGPSSMSFRVVAGESMTLPVSFRNPSSPDNPDSETCVVTPTAPGGFTVSPNGLQSVPEGAMQVFSITFAPTVVGDWSGNLRLAWRRAGLSGTLEVTLSGVAVAPAVPATTSTTGSPTENAAAAAAAADAAAAANTGSSTVSQRLRAGWYVPTYESYVSLGRAWKPTTTVTTQPGFTASTTKHVFMRAAGTVTFQSENGPVWFQSENGPLYSVSGGNTSLVAKESVYIGGGGYVGIMSGYAGEPLPEDSTASYGDGNPERPAPIDKVPPAFLAADWVWSIADKVVNLASAAYLVMHTVSLGNHKKALGKTACIVSSTAQVVGLASFIYGRAVGSPKKEANFYSQAGILMGTPAFCSIYGTMGVNYRSANITLLGNIAVAVNSIGATSLDSVFGDTAVASKDVNVSCWSGIFVYATQGKQTVLGTKIKLGGFKPDGLQVPTDSLQFQSSGAMDVSTTLPGSSKIALKARSMGVWPDPLATLNAGATMAVKADAPKTIIRVHAAEGPPTWTIEASVQGIEIKNATGEALFSMKVGIGITLGPVGAQIKLTPASTDVGSGAMTITPGSMLVGGMGELL